MDYEHFQRIFNYWYWVPSQPISYTTPDPLFLDIERHVETELNETKEFYKKKQKISAVEKKGKVFCLLPLEKHFFPPRETNYPIIAR